MGTARWTMALTLIMVGETENPVISMIRAIPYQVFANAIDVVPIAKPKTPTTKSFHSGKRHVLDP